MTKSAREVIVAELFWPFEGVYGDPGEMANDYASRIVSELEKAGYVILPKEPSEGAILAIETVLMTNMDGSLAHEVYYAAISHAEGEKG